METKTKAQTKIFLVDDNLFTLSMFQQGLENLGYSNFSLFFNGRICLENLHQKPDVIFLDYNLDDMCGLDVLKTIKAHTPNAYVIIVSAQENMKIALNAIKQGAFDYIIKGDNELEKMDEVISRIEALQTKAAKVNQSFITKLFSGGSPNN